MTPTPKEKFIEQKVEGFDTTFGKSNPGHGFEGISEGPKAGCDDCDRSQEVRAKHRDFLRQALNEAWEAGHFHEQGHVDLKVTENFNRELKDEGSKLVKIIQQAERKMLRKEIEGLWTDFDGQREGEACRLYRKVLALLNVEGEK